MMGSKAIFSPPRERALVWGTGRNLKLNIPRLRQKQHPTLCCPLVRARGVGNAHTSAIAGTQSELGTFNKLPSGPSPGVGHKVTNGYTEMAQESESKKSAIMENILPSGPSPGVGNSATNGRNMIEKISIESESKKKTALTLESESKKKTPYTALWAKSRSRQFGYQRAQYDGGR
jgi:hypothetical protein